MKEQQGDIFDFLNDEETDVICITTNGITNSQGLAIMGAGTAGEAARRWSDIRENLGKALRAYGNEPSIIGKIDLDGQFMDRKRVIASLLALPNSFRCYIMSFPTKDDFRHPSKVDLIVKSAERMVRYADAFGWKKIIIPQPGCGKATGKLNWETEVKPALEKVIGFDDRFVIVSLEEK